MKKSRDNKTTNTRKERKSPLRMAAKVLHGQVISSDFFARNWLLILVGITMILVYITNKYNCQTSMEEIKRLNTQLEVARTEAIRVRSEYMSKLTERSMQARLDSLHLDLKVQEQPPFKITADK